MNYLKTSTIKEISLEQKQLKPFLRWAGGKQNLVNELAKNQPQIFNRYFEPFVGAGSLFFHNNFQNAVLSDINPHLINAYQAIKKSAKDVHKKLIYHNNKLNSDYYYLLRSKFNNRKNIFDLEQAAIFIFLIHTSFNGIYRVNKKGEYNVPVGKLNPAIPSLEHLIQIQSKLESTILINCMYQDVLDQISRNDFVYFDPPYPPLNSTSYFQHYSIEKFPLDQQIELAEQANRLSKRGVKVMISNAETPLIKKIYKGWNIKKVSTFRFVNCKSKRETVNELIITNY